MPVSDGNNNNGRRVKRTGLSALEAWGRQVTQGYRDVHISDLSTSWRDGLAFCAIIHHFRSDLIDYDSLRRENVAHNNQLAFTVAERHLHIPALLDPDDMVRHAEPDKRSVALYLSQLYNHFEGKRPPVT